MIDIGAHRLRYIATPHVPHAWDAGVYYDETTSTLLCGDLFTEVGQSKALVNSELVGPAMLAEDMFAATCLTPQTGATMRRLAELEPGGLRALRLHQSEERPAIFAEPREILSINLLRVFCSPGF